MSGAIPFPPSPTVGQIFTYAGTSWQWNGTQWVNANTPGNFVPVAGNVTMTGPLTLSGNAAQPLQPTPLQQAQALVLPAQNNVGRNLLHNGLMNVAQRGAGPFTTSGAYTLDRWQLALGLDTASVGLAVLNDTDRGQIGDESAINALQIVFTGTAGAAAYTQVGQPIENVRRLAGKPIIVSFYAVASAALRLGVNGYQSYGSGGSPSAPDHWAATGSAVTLAVGYQRYSVSFTVPTSAGKTLGTTAGSDLSYLQFYFSSGATNNAFAGNIGVQSGTIRIWGVQLEIAQAGQTQPTPLEKLDPVLQLDECLRFYQILHVNIWGFAQAGTGQTATQTFTYPKVMRAAPSVTTIQGYTTQINLGGGSWDTVYPDSLRGVIQIPGAGPAYAAGGIIGLSADL